RGRAITYLWWCGIRWDGLYSRISTILKNHVRILQFPAVMPVQQVQILQGAVKHRVDEIPNNIIRGSTRVRIPEDPLGATIEVILGFAKKCWITTIFVPTH